MAVSFLDKLRLSDEEKVEKYTAITLKKYNVAGLDDIISKIKDMKHEGYFLELVRICINYDKLYDENITQEEQEELVYIIKKYCKILGSQYFNLPPITQVIACKDLESFHNLLLEIYTNNLGRKLNKDELEKVYCNLDFFIMRNLDKFDQTIEKAVITAEYFKKLRKIKWGEKSRKLCLELGELKQYAGFPPRKTPARFQIENYLLDQFLAACSAVNNDRDSIEQEDVIVAFRTYFKLLKADIPALVEKLEKNKEK